MSSREALYTVIESSYGTPKATPVLGTDSFYNRMTDGGSSFTMEQTNILGKIPYGGGRSTMAEVFSDAVECKGKLKLVLYPGAMTQIYLNWAISVINSARTAPWTTTDASGVMPPGDLASLTFYHGWTQSDGSFIRDKYVGAKCEDWTLTLGEEGDARKLTFEASIVAVKAIPNQYEATAAPDATEFPLPAETDYPTGPWLFSHVANGTGTVKVGSARSQIAGLTISGKNKLDARRYESRFIQICRFTGREASAELDLRLKVTPDDRSAYRAITAQDAEILLDNGTDTFKIDFNGKNYWGKYERNFPLDKEFGRKLTLENYWDAAAGTDIAVSFT